MKILLSAYFCDPRYRGGEHGVGWRWALEAEGQGHDVWVITRAHSHSVIERRLDDVGSNIKFVYQQIPSGLEKTLGRVGLWRMTYMVWQLLAYWRARELHDNVGFDVVHHLTMGDFRQPSFMGGLGTPFVIGPIGGGERAPLALRWGLGFAGWWSELLRDLGNLFPRVDPLSHRCLRDATLILVRTPATLLCLPKRYRRKSRLLLGIGADLDGVARAERGPATDRLRVLFVGRLIPWKGVHLALRALAQVAKLGPNVSLTIVGRGPRERKLRELSSQLGLCEMVSWATEWISDERLSELYRTHDVFLFPSLHEAGGAVVVEALAHGLPVICLDIGGPAVIVDSTCGRVIKTRTRPIDTVVAALTEAVQELAINPSLCRQLSAGAKSRAEQYGWPTIVANAYAPLLMRESAPD